MHDLIIRVAGKVMFYLLITIFTHTLTVHNTNIDSIVQVSGAETEAVIDRTFGTGVKPQTTAATETLLAVHTLDTNNNRSILSLYYDV